MSSENTWIMSGLDWDDPDRIRSWRELTSYVDQVGFLPLFKNEIRGFSAEEQVSSLFWWTGDPEQDPWAWRELIAADHQVAYGKFFDKKAGFISLEWLPCFANARRNGYDFDARWEDGLASRREKIIMDRLTDKDPDGDMTFPDRQILSTDLKKQAGFGKNGEKNYPGIITGLQMQTYLVITDFHRRVNKKGAPYGMPVSVLQPPEAVWGYETITSAYHEKPAGSWQKIYDHMTALYPGNWDRDIVKMIGKRPG